MFKRLLWLVLFLPRGVFEFSAVMGFYVLCWPLVWLVRGSEEAGQRSDQFWRVMMASNKKFDSLKN